MYFVWLVTGKPLVSSMSSHVFRMGFGAPLVTNMGGHGAFRSPMYFVWDEHHFPGDRGRLHVLPYWLLGVLRFPYEIHVRTYMETQCGFSPVR